MSDTFQYLDQHRFDGELGYDPDSVVNQGSPDQIAMTSGRVGEIVSAIPIRNPAAPGTYDVEVVHLPLDQQLLTALNLMRQGHSDFPGFSDATQYLTVVDDFSERTKVLALNAETLALRDVELFEWLVNAERQMYLGTDNHPIFEMSLDETACSFTRLPNGQIAMTEASRESVIASRQRMRSLFGDAAISTLNLGVETSTRSAARYYLSAVPDGVATVNSNNKAELTAFLLISRSGFSFGLWSPLLGLFSEYAFLAPAEISLKNGRETPGKIVRTSADEDAKQLRAYIEHAIEQLAIQLSPDRMDELGMSRYSQVVWATETELEPIVSKIVDKYPTENGSSFLPLGVPISEAVVGGLLFGSFTFGDEVVLGAEVLPQVNLARDLLVLADKEEVKRRHIGEIRMQKRRRQAVFTIFAGPVIVFALLAALVADYSARTTYFSLREARADAKTTELKPALERRKSYEANLKWYQEFIKQVSELRKQQPVGIGMLYQLNQSYPFDLDPSFYIGDLKLKPDAGIEITGLARRKDAVTSFLRSLEFAGGAESGSRLFSNLTYEVIEGVATPGVTAGSPADAQKLTDSTLTGAGPAPGVIAWTIRGNYLPMAGFIPPDPKKVPPGAPPAASSPPPAPNAPAPAGQQNPTLGAPPAAAPPPQQ